MTSRIFSRNFFLRHKSSPCMMMMMMARPLLCTQTVVLLLLSGAVALSVGRRRLLVRCTAAIPFLVASSPSFADDDSFQLQVTVTLPSTVDKTELLGPDTALYVTARPVDASGIPSEIMMVSSGKVPPVLTARFPKADVDLTGAVVLTQKDATLEGSNWKGWKGKSLVVSARLDSDGVAATRGPDDLVGRAVADASTTPSVTVPLQGRGITGKFLTGG